MVMGMIGFDMALSVLFRNIIQNNLSCFNGFLKVDTSTFQITVLDNRGKGWENKAEKRVHGV